MSGPLATASSRFEPTQGKKGPVPDVEAMFVPHG